MQEGDVKDFVFYTTQQVADIFEVTTETVRDWIAKGDMKAMRLHGGSFRIKKEDVEAFIQKRYEGDEDL